MDLENQIGRNNELWQIDNLFVFCNYHDDGLKFIVIKMDGEYYIFTRALMQC